MEKSESQVYPHENSHKTHYTIVVVTLAILPKAQRSFLGGSGGMLPHTISKCKLLRLAEN